VEEMTDLQKYLFDLQGFLVVEDALSESECDEMNRLIDEKHPGVDEETKNMHSGGFLKWGQPFVDLLDHEAIMPLLRFILGDGFRLDHYYAIRLQKGADRLGLHGGNRPYDPPEYYHFRNDRMYNGLTVVAWCLTDCGPDEGGFCCIPGSHKGNFPTPREVYEQHIESPAVTVPKAPAGSVLIFTEALTHGTAPWTADHERRSLLNKYSPSQQSWSKKYMQPPPGVVMTERQKLLFEKPYHHARRSLFEDDAEGR
jgi:hypothetical protein